MTAPMTREKPRKLVHLPFSESDGPLASTVNLQVMLIGNELTRTLILPSPYQRPFKVFRNSASLACAATPQQSMAADRNKVMIVFIVTDRASRNPALFVFPRRTSRWIYSK